MKKKLLWIFVLIILISTMILIYNYFSKSITNDDIAEGKQVVKNLFKALKDEDVKGANATLGKYKEGLWNESNIDDWKLELLSIEYFKNDRSHLPPHSYKHNYGHGPYQSMSLLVTFTDNSVDNEDKEMKWYYILVKETKDAQWKIHDWGV